jgi:hypothetical protein
VLAPDQLASLPCGPLLLDCGYLQVFRTVAIAGQAAELWEYPEGIRDQPRALETLESVRQFVERHRLACLPTLLGASPTRLVLAAPPWVRLRALEKRAAELGGLPAPFVATFVHALARDFATLPPDAAVSCAPELLAITTGGQPRLLAATNLPYRHPFDDPEMADLPATFLSFLAPEQLQHDGPVTRATTVYSLGGIAYSLLAGQRPFPQTEVSALIHALVDGTLPPLASLRRDLPPSLHALVDAMLRREPLSRIPCDDVRRTLELNLGHALWSPERMWAEVATLVPAEVEAAIVYGV